MQWAVRILAVVALVVVGWVLVTALPAVVHGHPAYAILLALALVASGWGLWRHRSSRAPVHGWRRLGSIALMLGAVVGLVAVWWLRPFSAQEPALAAMESDNAVAVTESMTRIVMTPRSAGSSTAVFFQPGAKVEARAYAAVLRPLAESGHRVVIVKQPMGIAFLSMGAFARVRSDFPDVAGWVLGGHSLGGTVAAMQADGSDSDPHAAARGLLLYASYPGGDISASLAAGVRSIYGTNDELATPADIRASKTNLPKGAQFVAIEGAVHSFFGDYGIQPGDGEPTVSHDEARTQIGRSSVEFVDALAGKAP